MTHLRKNVFMKEYISQHKAILEHMSIADDLFMYCFEELNLGLLCQRNFNFRYY